MSTADKKLMRDTVWPATRQLLIPGVIAALALVAYYAIPAIDRLAGIEYDAGDVFDMLVVGLKAGVAAAIAGFLDRNHHKHLPDSAEQALIDISTGQGTHMYVDKDLAAIYAVGARSTLNRDTLRFTWKWTLIFLAMVGFF